MLEKRAENGKKSRKKSAAVASLFLEVVPGAMRELRREARAYSGGSLTIPQFRILAQIGCQLEEGPGANNKSLAEALGVSVAATSRMVDLLVKKGLVERYPCARDRREIELRLSPKGAQEFDNIRVAIRGRFTERLESVPEKELLKAEAGLLALQKMLNLLYRSRQ